MPSDPLDGTRSRAGCRTGYQRLPGKEGKTKMKYLVKCAWTVAGKKKETAEEFDTYGGAKGFAENVLFLLDGTDVTVLIYELKESMN